MKNVLVGRAREFRRVPTPTEERLWQALRKVRVAKFRRQCVIGPFIADLACHRPPLVVEVDGPVHDLQRERDRAADRDRWFAAQGYRVLHFPSAEVDEDLDGVIETILGAVLAED